MCYKNFVKQKVQDSECHRIARYVQEGDAEPGYLGSFLSLINLEDADENACNEKRGNEPHIPVKKCYYTKTWTRMLLNKIPLCKLESPTAPVQYCIVSAD